MNKPTDTLVVLWSQLSFQFLGIAPSVRESWSFGGSGDQVFETIDGRSDSPHPANELA